MPEEGTCKERRSLLPTEKINFIIVKDAIAREDTELPLRMLQCRVHSYPMLQEIQIVWRGASCINKAGGGSEVENI